MVDLDALEHYYRVRPAPENYCPVCKVSGKVSISQDSATTLSLFCTNCSYSGSYRVGDQRVIDAVEELRRLREPEPEGLATPSEFIDLLGDFGGKCYLHGLNQERGEDIAGDYLDAAAEKRNRLIDTYNEMARSLQAALIVKDMLKGMVNRLVTKGRDA